MRIDGGSTPAFKPAWWCRNPHLQTLWPQIARLRSGPRYRREVLDLPDGDFIDIDWLDHPDHRAIAILIHGLGGNSRSPYIRALANHLKSAGFSVAAMNMRGASGRPNRRPKTYHSGHTKDLDSLLETLVKRAPHTSIVCAGFSLGGNVLLKWLGENPASDRLKAAVAVSAPFVLDGTAKKMNTGIARIYQARLIAQLRKSLKQRRHLFTGRFDMLLALKAKNFYQFDNMVTAPVNGYENSQHYYNRCSSRQFLYRINTPTLLIQSEDDPFMTPQVVPHRDECSRSTTLEVHAHGGHVGFVGGVFPGLSTYLPDTRIPDFFIESLFDPPTDVIEHSAG